MEFVNDPIKSKRVFILMLILTIVFFLAASSLGTMYYFKIRSAAVEKRELENRLASATIDMQKKVDQLEKDKKDLEEEKSDLEKEKNTLKGQIASVNAKLAKVKAYNDVLNYLYTLIQAHNGFTGWTQADYEAGRVKAQATGDSNLVTTVDWVWNNPNTDLTTRLVAILKAISDGIGNSL